MHSKLVDPFSDEISYPKSVKSWNPRRKGLVSEFLFDLWESRHTSVCSIRREITQPNQVRICIADDHEQKRHLIHLHLCFPREPKAFYPFNGDTSYPRSFNSWSFRRRGLIYRNRIQICIVNNHEQKQRPVFLIIFHFVFAAEPWPFVSLNEGASRPKNPGLQAKTYINSIYWPFAESDRKIECPSVTIDINVEPFM